MDGQPDHPDQLERIQPPAWLTEPTPAPVESEASEPAPIERDAERYAIQTEPPLDTNELEPVRFEPGERGQQDALAHLQEAKAGILTDWIERVGADGRLGYDKPGIPIAERWWQHVAFEDLPDGLPRRDEVKRGLAAGRP